MNKKISIIISLLLVAILLIGAFFIYNRQEANNPPNEEEKQNQENVQKAMDRTFSWLGTIKDEQGLYYRGEAWSYRDGVSVIWGEFKYLENSDNPNKESLLQDIRNYSDREIAKIIQNDFWNCKLMEDLMDSSIFNSEELEMVSKICILSEYEHNAPFWEAILKIEDTDLDPIKESIYSKIDEFLEKGKVSINYQEILDNDPEIYEYPFFSSDYISRYFIGGETRKDYINSAFWLFDVYLERLSESFDSISQEELCSAGVAALDLNRMDNNNKLIDFSKEILSLSEKKDSSFYGNTVCSFLANEIYKETNNEEYLNKKYSLIENNIENYFDDEDSLIYLNEGGFIEKYGEVFEKSSRYNGLFLGILSESLK
jgi:hypothetical protein